jgi:hypothetical protein
LVTTCVPACAVTVRFISSERWRFSDRLASGLSFSAEVTAAPDLAA